MENDRPLFAVGKAVSKVGGDYTFEGTVVSVFKKVSGAVRLVIEDDRGMLHISTETNVQYRKPK